jgi:hypothetical protein
MFSAFAFGSFFLISGLLGFRADRLLRGMLRWEDGPLLSHVAIGTGLLALGVFWYHHLADSRFQVFRHPPSIRNVGAGKSAGAAGTKHDRVGTASK